jgi:hypothetical protein
VPDVEWSVFMACFTSSASSDFRTYIGTTWHYTLDSVESLPGNDVNSLAGSTLRSSSRGEK